MLRKLMKYEFKSTGRTFLPMYGALLLSALMTRLMLWGDSNTSMSNTFLYNLISGLVACLFVALLMATFVVTLVVMIQRFRKNLLGEEGYLSMTLPVKPWQHILSKSIVAIVWYFASFVAAMLSFILLVWERNFIRHLWDGIVFVFTKIQWDTQTIWFCFELILLTVVSIFATVLLMYASMALGQTSNHSRKMASFGYFLALSLGSNFISGIVGRLCSPIFHYPIYNFQRIHGVLWFFIVLMSLFSAAYFFIANYMLTHKLNLE